MQTKPHSIWWPRVATFLLWVAAAGSLAFWALKWPGMGAALPVIPAGLASTVQSDQQAMARLFGAGNPVAAAVLAPAGAGRYALTGVLASPTGTGVALISVDGKPARPIEVGGAVDEQLVLKSVVSRQATLAGSVEGSPSMIIELPPLKRLAAPTTPAAPAKAFEGPVPARPNPFDGKMPRPSAV